MINYSILKENVKLILFAKGWTQDRLAMHMGWSGSATFARKFSKDAKWSFEEINRLLKWADKTFDEVFVRPLLD